MTQIVMMSTSKLSLCLVYKTEMSPSNTVYGNRTPSFPSILGRSLGSLHFTRVTPQVFLQCIVVYFDQEHQQITVFWSRCPTIVSDLLTGSCCDDITGLQLLSCRWSLLHHVGGCVGG